MEGREQRIPLSYQLKEFIPRHLEEAGSQTLELARQVLTFEFKEDLESALLKVASSVIARFLVAY